MARVFNGKVEAEIREDCSAACNLCLTGPGKGAYRLPARRSVRSRSIAATCLGRLAWAQASARRRRSCQGATTFIFNSDQGFLRQAALKGLAEMRDLLG